MTAGFIQKGLPPPHAPPYQVAGEGHPQRPHEPAAERDEAAEAPEHQRAEDARLQLRAAHLRGHQRHARRWRGSL